jgi:Protein of unknown function (DUF2971)
MAKIRSYIEPARLYRYRSLKDETQLERELLALNEGYLWCSRFEDLNDPMEGAFLTDKWKEIFDTRYLDLKEYIFDRKSTLGICSFSEVNDHELMWAHYADQFRGICFEYSVERLLNVLDDDVDLVRLFYNEKAYRLGLSAGSDRAIAKKVLSHKNHRWLYEREWRVLSPTIGKVSLNKDNCISRVYIGNRIKPEYKEKILAALSGKRIAYKILEIDGYSIRFDDPQKTKFKKVSRP